MAVYAWKGMVINLNTFKKIILFITAGLLLQIALAGTAMAESKDYTLDGTQRISIPETYTLKRVLYNFSSGSEEARNMSGAEDLFINDAGYLYVADTGNSRVLKMTGEGKLLNIYKGPKEKPLNSPRGVFADHDGNLYIADTGNKRIVHLSAEGEFMEEFGKPDSPLLGKNFSFEPAKVALSPTGYIYTIKGQSILVIDAYNRFRGYLGQSDIGFHLVDVLLRWFASEEQKKFVRKRTAATYTNLTLDAKGMIYATSLDMLEGEIKKLNSVGENIYRKYSTSDGNKLLEYLTTMNLTDKTFIFGERKDDGGNPYKPVFIDAAVDKNGVVTALEQYTGKLYQYDQDGNLLTVFGGKSDQMGKFDFPTSVAVDRDGYIYVLDATFNNIQVFEPTRFIKLVHEAVKFYDDGDYDKAHGVWRQVLRMDENYQLAHVGMAKALYKQQDFTASMDEFTWAEDRSGYSTAYEKFRHDIFRRNFPLVVAGVVLAAILLVFVFKGIQKLSDSALEEFRTFHPGRMRMANVAKLSLAMLTHPVEVFEHIKDNRGRLNLLPGILILVLVVAVRVFYIYTVHFPLADIDVKDANIVLETVKLLLPLLTWVIASFAITAILDGESKIDEIFMATAFCMVPYILINLPLPLFSNLLGRSEEAFYAVMSNGTVLWVLILLFTSVKTMNNYRMDKSVVVCTISTATIALVWAVILLGLVLVGALYEFAAGLVREISTTWM